MKANYSTPTMDFLMFVEEDILVTSSLTAEDKLRSSDKLNNAENVVSVDWEAIRLK